MTFRKIIPSAVEPSPSAPMKVGTELQGLPTIEADKVYKKDVLGATLPTPSTPPTRTEVLTRILDMVGPVNFRELAKVTEEIKVLRSHQKVVVVRELLLIRPLNIAII